MQWLSTLYLHLSILIELKLFNQPQSTHIEPQSLETFPLTLVNVHYLGI